MQSRLPALALLWKPPASGEPRGTVEDVTKRDATDVDRVQVRGRVLDVVSAGEPLTNLADTLASGDDVTFPFPADVCCELAADALRIAGATRSSPISLAGAPERLLPDREFRGNTARQKLRATLELAIEIHAGIEPDYDDPRGLVALSKTWTASRSTPPSS